MRQLDITNNPSKNRFEARLDDGSIAKIDYQRDDKTITYTYTEVPESHQGQGIASHMAQAALDYAKLHDLQVIAECPFVAKYVDEHPEYQGITSGY